MESMDVRSQSYATIQSDPKGQFTELLDRIESLPDYQRNLNRIADCDNDQEKIHLVDTLFLHSIDLVPMYKKKDDVDALQSRKAGNELFQKKRFREAIARYNRSVLRATGPDQNSDLMSMAVANRSACLFHLESYQEASSDIQMAFALGYPKEKRPKLYIRLAKCYLKTNQTSKAIGPLNIARSMLDPGLDEKERNVILDDIAKLEEAIKEDQPQNESQNQRECVADKWEKLPRPHSKWKSYSCNLDVKYSEDRGRFVVANEDIQTAETLVSERAFASALYPDRFGTNCQVCLKRLDITVPCPDCSGVAFCSVECRDSNNFHKHECKHLEALTGFGCSQVARLALRMITSRSFDYFAKVKNEVLKNAGDPMGTSSSSAYVNVFNLANNNDQRWAEDTLRRSLMAGILLKLLRSGNYFPPDTTRSDEMYIGALLLRNLQVLQFNAHEVYEVWRSNPKAFRPFKSQVIALAIYQRASLFNHSCYGSVARFFIGDRMIVKSLRPISKGEEVSENYGPTFYFKPRPSRQKELRTRYWFTCRCDACHEDWPMLEQLPKSSDAAVAPLFKSLIETMDQGDMDRAIRTISNLMDRLKRRGCKVPSEELIRIEDKLRTCISNMGTVVIIEASKKK